VSGPDPGWPEKGAAAHRKVEQNVWRRSGTALVSGSARRELAPLHPASPARGAEIELRGDRRRGVGHRRGRARVRFEAPARVVFSREEITFARRGCSGDNSDNDPTPKSIVPGRIHMVEELAADGDDSCARR